MDGESMHCLLPRVQSPLHGGRSVGVSSWRTYLSADQVFPLTWAPACPDNHDRWLLASQLEHKCGHLGESQLSQRPPVASQPSQGQSLWNAG